MEGQRDIPLAYSPQHQSCFQGQPKQSWLESILLRALETPMSYKWEVGRISRRCLDQELISPTVQRLKTLGIVDVVNKNTAVCATVKSHAQRLESFLTSSIPELLDHHQYGFYDICLVRSGGGLVVLTCIVT